MLIKKSNIKSLCALVNVSFLDYVSFLIGEISPICNSRGATFTGDRGDMSPPSEIAKEI